MMGQILLLRELITVFYGNETAYAIVLASWLFWVAVGSFLASRFLGKFTKPENTLGFFFSGVAFILPLSIVLIRVVKNLVGLAPGVIVGNIPMGIISFILLAPLTLLLGGTFTLLCRIMESQDSSSRVSAMSYLEIP